MTTMAITLPAGRTDAAAAARAHTADALAALVRVLSDTTAALDARMEAARAVLEPRQGIAGHPAYASARKAAEAFLAALAGAA
ncbi:MAG: hypothetical protein IT561_13565 [Alphaproteobacteria bacterium]|nr:hypothetical protein [Alphaproteobacteria bacterium]